MWKRFALLVTVLCNVVPLAAAQTTLVWQRSFNTISAGSYPYRSDDTLLAAQRDAAGNVYLTGETSWPWSPPTFKNPVTAKYDAAGNLLWAQQHDVDRADDAGQCIAVDPDDASVYVGTSPAGGVVLLKYDTDGNLLWASTPYAPVGGSATIGAPRCVLDSAGNVYLGVTATGATSDIGVISYDPSGSLRWATTIDGPAQQGDVATYLAIDASDRVYVLGGVDDTGDEQAAIAQLNTAGAVVWSSFQPSGAGGDTRARALDLDPNGNVYVLAGGFTEWRVSKYDPAGNELWSTPVAASGISLGALAVDAFGAVTAVGYSASFNADWWVFHLDPAGVVAWSNTYDGPAHRNDFAAAVAIDAVGEIVVAGSTTTNQQISLNYNSDFLVRRYTPAGSLRPQYQHPGFSMDSAQRVFVGAGGDLIVAGSMRTTFSTQPLLFHNDLFVMSLTENVQPFCAGDAAYGSCPCGNSSSVGAGSGCANSLGVSALLTNIGSASLANDTLKFTTTNTLPVVLTILLQGDQLITPVPFGDGLRCIGGNLLRLYAGNASGGTWVIPQASDPDVSARAAALGDPLSPGSSRGYQVYYRDPNLAFCSSPQGSSWNVSNGRRITWSN